MNKPKSSSIHLAESQGELFFECQPRLRSLAKRFKRKLLECTAKGFEIEACFDFLWKEAVDEEALD